MNYYNFPEDIQWLKDTHLKDGNRVDAQPLPAFASFTIEGNEDCPKKIDLFEKEEPLYIDKPIASFLLNDFGQYVKA